MRPLRALPLVTAALVLTACGGAGEPAVKPAPTVTVTETVTATETMTVEAQPTEPADPLAGMFPKGFPKKVKVSDIPFPVNSEYEDFEFAVQLAPGVWTSLPPGATVEDAALVDVADGYCASIDAFVRKYRDGDEMGGSCW